MSKFVCTFDTVTKEAAVTKDGRAVDNVNCFELYPSWQDDGKMSVRVCQAEMDSDEKLTTMTVQYASAAGAVETRPATAEEVARLSPPSPSPAKSLAKAIAALSK
jgi:hypothetical protein